MRNVGKILMKMTSTFEDILYVRKVDDEVNT